MSESIFGHNLVTLSALATAWTTKDPNDRQLGFSQWCFVNVFPFQSLYPYGKKIEKIRKKVKVFSALFQTDHFAAPITASFVKWLIRKTWKKLWALPTFFEQAHRNNVMQKCRTHLLGKAKKRRLQRCRNDLFKVIVLKIWPVWQNITLFTKYHLDF